MTAEAVAAAWYDRQRAINAATVRRLATLWKTIGTDDLDRSWRAVLARLEHALAAGQLRAASDVDAYVDRILAEQDIDTDPDAEVDPAGFAGTTADGRPNRQMLFLPVLTAKLQIRAGRDADDAVAVAGRTLIRLAATEVADTGRSAVMAAMAARPQATAWVRRARGASTCDRCISRTTRPYRWQASFDRHPRCDCIAIPTTAGAASRFLGRSRATSSTVGMASVAQLSRRSSGAAAADQIVADATSRSHAISRLRRAGYLT